MISLSIDRSSLGITALTISDDGTGTFTLMPGFSAGASVPINVVAESRWQDGGVLTSSRRDLTSLDMTLRINGGGVWSVNAATAELATALDQFSYTVTVNEGGYAWTYQAMPATWRRLYVRDELRRGRDLVTVSIPRQP